MAIIPNGSKFFSQSQNVNTEYGGSKALKEESKWYTMQDIADTVGGGGGSSVKLNFTWSKGQQQYSDRIIGAVFLLGMSLDNITLEENKTYNLLINRYRFSERVATDNDTGITTFRTAGFKRETDFSAEENNRVNKFPVLTTDLEYYYFYQDYFFKEVIEDETQLWNSVFATGTALKQIGRDGNKRGWLHLSFDLEIINEDESTEVIKDIGLLVETIVYT